MLLLLVLLALSIASEPSAERPTARVAAPRTAVVGRVWQASVRVSPSTPKPTLQLRRGGVRRALVARRVGPRVWRFGITFRAPGRWRYEVRLGRRVVAAGAVTVRPAPLPRYRFLQPAGIALAGDTLYVSDTRGERVFRMSVASGRIEPFAGTGVKGDTGDGGPALRARLDFPRDVALGADGDVFIATGHKVRKVDAATGLISTVAGTNRAGPHGDGGPASAANLGYVLAVAVDPQGTLYLAEVDDEQLGIRNAHRISRVDAASRVLSTIAGDGPPGSSGDGGPAVRARVNATHGLAPTADGLLYLGDSFNHKVRRIDLGTGVIDTVAGTGSAGYGGDGGPARSATLQNPSTVIREPGGTLVFGDFFNNRIRRIGLDGVITTVAGNGDQAPGPDGRPAPQTAIGGPGGLALAPDGDLLFAAMASTSIRRVDAQTGLVSTVGPR